MPQQSRDRLLNRRRWARRARPTTGRVNHSDARRNAPSEPHRGVCPHSLFPASTPATAISGPIAEPPRAGPQGEAHDRPSKPDRDASRDRAGFAGASGRSPEQERTFSRCATPQDSQLARQSSPCRNIRGGLRPRGSAAAICLSPPLCAQAHRTCRFKSQAVPQPQSTIWFRITPSASARITTSSPGRRYTQGFQRLCGLKITPAGVPEKITEPAGMFPAASSNGTLPS